jgi:hypothetical protein
VNGVCILLNRRKMCTVNGVRPTTAPSVWLLFRHVHALGKRAQHRACRAQSARLPWEWHIALLVTHSVASLHRPLCRWLQGKPLVAFWPQSTFLGLISTGRKHCIATKGGWCFEVRGDHPSVVTGRPMCLSV